MRLRKDFVRGCDSSITLVLCGREESHNGRRTGRRTNSFVTSSRLNGTAPPASIVRKSPGGAVETLTIVFVVVVLVMVGVVYLADQRNP
jgi:hypothetical protein